MTRVQFVAKAVREYERRMRFPSGWWGTWRDIHGPRGVRIRANGGVWTLSKNGKLVSRHDSREFAIKKGRRA